MFRLIFRPILRALFAAILSCVAILMMTATVIATHTQVETILDSFRNYDISRNDFFAPVGSLNNACSTITQDPNDTAPGAKGPSLELVYDFSACADDFTGLWEFLWGEANDANHYLDFTADVQEIRFWVRNSEPAGRNYRLKVELKDVNNNLAYQYVDITDEDTGWRDVALDADVTNTSEWRYIGQPPNPARMKQLVLVIEQRENPSSGGIAIDDIRLVAGDPTPSGEVLTFESFRNLPEGRNDFNGNTGPLNDACIDLTQDPDAAPGAKGPSLRAAYDFAECEEDFTGIWESIWGDADDPGRSFNFTNEVRAIRLRVRGTGETGQIYNLKVELKDTTGDFLRTAYRYILIDDGDTQWQEITIDADVTNHTVWQFNGEPPDPTRMKQMVLVQEKRHNPSSGAFYLDDIQFLVNEELEPIAGSPVMLDSYRHIDEGRNDLNGSMGPLNGDRIILTPIDAELPNPTDLFLRVDFDLSAPEPEFTGLWESMWGAIDNEARYLDFTKGFEQIHLSVRGAGTNKTYNLRIELKDVSGEYTRTAYRYFQVDDSSTEWRRIVLDADVTNGDFWTYPELPPDPTRMKELILVLERDLNPPTGSFFIEDLQFVTKELEPLTGLPYILENYDDRDSAFNDFSGNWGELNSEAISTSFDSDIYAGEGGSSLRLDYRLDAEDSPDFTGVWQSIWSHIEGANSIDFSDIYGLLNEPNQDFEQIHFLVRGSGQSTNVHNIKVELKDVSGDFERTAFHYVYIDDIDTNWRKVVLDADVTNREFWSYNEDPPDPTNMKQMVFVVEQGINQEEGTFYLDDIHFVDADDQPFDPTQHSDDEFLEFVSKRTFQYFLDWYDPETGLYQDRSTIPDLYSIASTGFGLTALIIGTERNWIERDVAKSMVLNTLEKLEAGHSATTTVSETISQTNGYKGFYYHFLNADGLRADGSELSSVDTAILMAGVLTAREYFSDDPVIGDLATRLYGRVEWPWMKFTEQETESGRLPREKQQFYLGWKPQRDGSYEIDADGSEEDGGYFSGSLNSATNEYEPASWDTHTDEVILINLLAIGSPTYPVDRDVFYSWYRQFEAYRYEGRDLELVSSWPGSFFTYIFAHLWIDFAAVDMDNHPMHEERVDWWNNTVKAALTNWQFSVDHVDDQTCNHGDGKFTTYGATSWGLTAAEGPPGIARYTWSNNTDDRSALQSPLSDDPTRKATTGYAHSSFELDIKLSKQEDETQGQTCVSFYFLDWDDRARKQSISVRGEKTSLNEKVVEFQQGKYVRFPIQEDVTVIFSRDNITNTVINTVVSGIFFDPYTPECEGIDATTGGDWRSANYGSDGFLLIGWNGPNGDYGNLPSYVESIDFDSGYHAYGAPPSVISGPKGNPSNAENDMPIVVPDHDGTIAPYGAGMAVMLRPREGKLQDDVAQKAIDALRHYYTETDLWRYRFGFGDAYNLDPPDCGAPWYNRVTFGIDQGPMLLAIENYRSGLIWNVMAANPWLHDALANVFLPSQPGRLEPSDTATSSTLDGWPQERLIDGEPGPAWSSVGNAGHLAESEWASIILAERSTVDRVRLRPRGNRNDPDSSLGFPKDFVLQYSFSGSEGDRTYTCDPNDPFYSNIRNWRPLLSYNGYPQPGNEWLSFDFNAVQAQCIRLLGVELSQDDYGYRYLQIGEFEAYHGDEKLAAEGVSTSSALENWPEERLIDGEPGPAWSSVGNDGHLSESEWVAAILAERQTIDQVRIRSRGNRNDPDSSLGFPKDFVLQYSYTGVEGDRTYTCAPDDPFFSDIRNWRPLLSYNGFAQPGNEWLIFDFDPVEAGCVRLLGVELSQDDYGYRYMQIGEIQISNDGVLIPPIKCVASSSLADWPVERLCDGEPGPAWSSVGNAGHLDESEWASIILAERRTVDSVRLRPRGNRNDPDSSLGFPKDFVLQYSHNGSEGDQTYTCDPDNEFYSDIRNWRPLLSYNGYPQPGNEWLSFEFNSVQAQCIRLLGVELSQDDFGYRYLQIGEFEASESD